MKRSKYEQEVIINFNAEEDTATVYTANPVWIRKMDKLVAENPHCYQCVNQELIRGECDSKTYLMPKRFISLRTKDKTMTLSEEQKEQARKRLPNQQGKD